ncbi:hypothetical protein [Borreliella turdi]|uniref:hypothetical protein n=1 Tax=Borreliella turdi TaxID=57863 RepID=UPI001243C025|nr:hypothetical protein [Borreliella turdi]
MYFYIGKIIKKFFIVIITCALFVFESCSSQFPSKAIENVSLALRDFKGSKKEDKKYNKEMLKQNIKILKSNPYSALLEQQIADDKVVNENSLLPNLEMENNDLREKSLPDVKVQDRIITKANQQFKYTRVLLTEDQIKADLDKFAEKDYEKKSLMEIKKAELILKDLSKNNLDKDISDINLDYKSLLDYLFSFHFLLDKLNKTPQSRRYLIRQMQRVKPIIQKNLEEMYIHTQNAHNYWESAKNMLKNAKDKLGESIHKRILNENRKEDMIDIGFSKSEQKRAKELANYSIEYANTCIENIEKAINSLQYGNTCKKEIKKYI